MRPPLPDGFLRAPIAHRALHDVRSGRAENSLSSIEAAIAAGYGIEIDLQLTSDGQAAVFHDYDLGRLTEASGAVRLRTMAELQQIPLRGGAGDHIPSLSEVLACVDGRVPVLVEIKDMDGAMGKNVGPLEQAAAVALTAYNGPVAVMSFNPNSTGEMARLAPNLPRGLVTDPFEPDDWPIPATVCADLREIPDFERTGSSFVSHMVQDLHRPRLRDLKDQGVPILCWTVRTPEIEAAARQIADNVTFEGYMAAIPA